MSTGNLQSKKAVYLTVRLRKQLESAKASSLANINRLASVPQVTISYFLPYKLAPNAEYGKDPHELLHNLPLSHFVFLIPVAVEDADSHSI